MKKPAVLLIAIAAVAVVAWLLWPQGLGGPQNASDVAYSADGFFEIRTWPEKRELKVGQPILFEFTIKQTGKTRVIREKNDEEGELVAKIDPEARWSVQAAPRGSSFIGAKGLITPRTWLKGGSFLRGPDIYEESTMISCTNAGEEDYTIDQPLLVTYEVLEGHDGMFLDDSVVHSFAVNHTVHYTCVGEGVVTSSAASVTATSDNQKYYVVKSTDPTGDTGNEVCAKAGKTCVGYTDLTIGTCLKFHPGATPSTDMNGSKAGFYCNGAPQGGICGQESNTCHICPACNLNMECDTVIGDFYRETFVECA